jgi:hypothetical protein
LPRPLAKDATGAMAWLLPGGATLAGVFSVAYSLRFIHDTFFNGEPVDLPKTPHEAPFFMRLPVLLLVLLCMAVGLAPAWWPARCWPWPRRPRCTARRARRCPPTTGHLARLEPAAADERGGRGRRRAAVLRPAALHQPAPRWCACRAGLPPAGATLHAGHRRRLWPHRAR